MGEWEEYDLDNMDDTLNEVVFQPCPFHPHQYIEVVNPKAKIGNWRYMCPQEGCCVFFFEDTRQIILDKLRNETHPQVRANLERCSLDMQRCFA